jgi:DNA-binding NtrC family response regulator
MNPQPYNKGGPTMMSDHSAAMTQDQQTENMSLEERLFSLSLSRARTLFEQRYIEHVLSASRGNIAGAARAAKVDRSNFRRLLRRHGIDPSRFFDAPSDAPPASGPAPK